MEVMESVDFRNQYARVRERLFWWVEELASDALSVEGEGDFGHAAPLL
jgi:hypothetical protein